MSCKVAFALPVTIIILVPFLRAIPRELEEAASIDGTSRLGFFWHIMLPLSGPGLITVGVRTWLNPSHLPQLDWWMWAALGVMIVVGIFTGEKLLRHIKDDHARVAVIIMAFVGALAALIKGLLDLNG